MIDNKLVLDWYIESDIDEYHIKPSNCIVCYIPNGFKDNKRNQKIFIKKKNYDSYETPKKFVDELDSYNGIQSDKFPLKVDYPLDITNKEKIICVNTNQYAIL